MNPANAKALAALALTGVGTALVVGFRVPDAAAAPASSVAATTVTTAGSAASGAPTSNATTSNTAMSNAATPSATASTGSATTAAASPATPSAATYANGTWTGSAVQEPWGTFQVQAVVSGGRLANVVLVSEPQDGHSSRINSQAVPLLTQSAIAAQSASIDTVSGATWTSQSYTTSLQAALDQATAAARQGG